MLNPDWTDELMVGLSQFKTAPVLIYHLFYYGSLHNPFNKHGVYFALFGCLIKFCGYLLIAAARSCSSSEILLIEKSKFPE